MTKENLISIESHSEVSLTDGKKESKVFVKMYVDAVQQGLLADMGDANWRTLCVISSFMDEDGNCYPTQKQIAKGLGVSRQAASRRVNNLLKYRWQGREIIRAVKGRTDKGTFDNTRYTVMPISQIRIFDAEPEELTSQQ